MPNLRQLDALYLQWADRTAIGRDEMESFNGPLPSQWEFSPDDQNLDELPHVLNDLSDEGPNILGEAGPLPTPLMAYRIGLWLGKPIPANHPLAVNCAKFRSALLDFEFGPPSNPAAKRALQTLFEFLRPFLPDWHWDELQLALEEQHFESDDRVYAFNANGQVVRMALSKDGTLTFTDGSGIRRCASNGQQMPVENPQASMTYLMQAPVTAIEPNELASAIGNDFAELLMPQDNISILDLPDQHGGEFL